MGEKLDNFLSIQNVHSECPVYFVKCSSNCNLCLSTVQLYMPSPLQVMYNVFVYFV